MKDAFYNTFRKDGKYASEDTRLSAGQWLPIFTRYLELLERGQQADFEQVLTDVVERDRQDMERAISPLKQAEDAQVVDTTGKDLEQSRALLRDVIRSTLGQEEEA